MDFKINENTTSLSTYSQKGDKLTFLVVQNQGVKNKKLFQRPMGPPGVGLEDLVL